ncbi:hypothetical protein ACKWTF_004382 [Chironomus riparius]
MDDFDDFIRLDVTEFQEGEDKLETSLTCRTIRIGSYKFETKDPVAITSKGIKIVAPTVKDVNDITVLNIQNSEIVKLVIHFSKQLSIIIVYTKPSCGRFIVEQLQMTQVNDKSPYYAPLSRNETQKKIIFLTENVSEDTKNALKAIFKEGRMEEINNRDANEMLVRSTGIPLTVTSQNPIAESNSNNSTQDVGELQKILTYPRGRGGITITVYDYLCLGSDNYLNDVIIDFYLKYTHTELLTKEQQHKTHIFSTFFYKRLTTMTKDQRTLTAAQKRHQRVQSWTKNVNLFEKDFIIIPINEQSHWFLAIICFPNLTEPHTMDTNQPIKLTFNQKKPKKKLPVQIGSTTITPLSKKDDSIEVHDDQASERDEAEGDDSELGSNVDSEEEEVIDKGQPVKVPCILIFDSLGGTSRARVVATLRDYLTCEYKAKYPNSPPRTYTKPNMLGCLVKVPQQQNFTDCGLFLLQYVEQFFKDPLKDFRIPIKTLSKWFHQDLVTRKREDVANLIKTLMKRDGFAEVDIPNIEFPTKDGKILEAPESQSENNTTMEEAFEDPDYTPDGEEDPKDNNSSQEEVTKKVYLPSKKRILDKTDSNGESSAAKNPKINKNKV